MNSVQLELLVKQTNDVSEELSRIKNDIEKQMNCNHYPSVQTSIYLDRAINLRLAFRNLAEGIQANRNLAQLQKEKIEKSKIFLEGLNYYKATLISKIKECDIDVINTDLYLKQPVLVDDWINGYSEAEKRLKGELQDKKNKKRIYEELINTKLQKQTEAKQKKELYQKVLPSQAKKILQQIQQTTKHFKIPQYDQYDGISNKDLSQIYDKLNPLRSSNSLELKLITGPHQQLEIIINKNDCKLHRIANANKIAIEQKQMKFVIASISPDYNKLIVGMDRRGDFINEEIFQRLVNNELIKPVFVSPQNQFERNTNARFVRLEWIDSMFLNGIITAEKLVDILKQRVFCLQLINYLKENMKKINFFFPLNTENEVAIPLNLKKASSGTLQKISFQQYLKIAHIPSWIQKYANFFQSLQTQKSKDPNNIQCKDSISKINFMNLLKIFKLEQLVNHNINNYYKGTIAIHQSRLQFVLIIPLSYPQQYSKINIIEWHKKKEQDKKTILLDVPCKFQSNLEVKAFPDKILMMEKAVNDDISEFMKVQEHGPFRIWFQLNRLLTLLGDQSQKKY